MLSNEEERELGLLEESLGDSGWRRLLRVMDGPLWQHRGKVWTLFAFGAVVMVCGAVTGSDDVVGQGLLIVSLVASYWLVMLLREQPAPPPGLGQGRAGRLPRGPGR